MAEDKEEKKEERNKRERKQGKKLGQARLAHNLTIISVR